MTRQLVAEADIAGRSLAEAHTIDPNLAVGHHPIKVNEDAPLGVTRGQGKMLAIPPDSGRKKGPRATAGIALIKRTFNAPVMRHVQCAPSRVVKSGLLGTRGICFEKAPIKIEGLDLARPP